ncbi:MAG: ribonuclease P protein component [Pseudomonadales bacterium]|nr:ribonuclease P protein component [Pseudomonadales bacterium]MDG1442582.1 ribonuclease P protein component [Pseudomonadales bacterium]
MIDQSLPAYRRLLTSPEFDAVFKDNHIRVSSPEFLVLAALTSFPASRLGMVIGKKNTNQANDRNKIKRAIRETFRKNFPHQPAVDVVIVSRKAVDPELPKILNAKLDEIWSKLSKKISTKVRDG